MAVCNRLLTRPALADRKPEDPRALILAPTRELAAQAFTDDTAAREIEIGVINRHNMAERTMRYTEQWRYDPEAGQWWISGGLPDLWAGE